MDKRETFLKRLEYIFDSNRMRKLLEVVEDVVGNAVIPMAEEIELFLKFYHSFFRVKKARSNLLASLLSHVSGLDSVGASLELGKKR